MPSPVNDVDLSANVRPIHLILRYFSQFFCIVDLGLDTSVYKPHSLRIDGASLAHDLNFSDAQIQSLGRWHSTSYQRYIRVPVLSASH